MWHPVPRAQAPSAARRAATSARRLFGRMDLLLGYANRPPLRRDVLAPCEPGGITVLSLIIGRTGTDLHSHTPHTSGLLAQVYQGTGAASATGWRARKWALNWPGNGIAFAEWRREVGAAPVGQRPHSVPWIKRPLDGYGDESTGPAGIGPRRTHRP